LLSLGVGFLPDLTGKDNIYLNGMYLGMSKKDIESIYDEIVAFADLGDFIHSQVRYYSSGMRARLGFSIAVHVEPDILVIDEVLSAGDVRFRKKARRKMKQFMRKASAIIIASHSMPLITDLCKRCLWLEHGKIRGLGNSDNIVQKYLNSQ
jgi:ABC-type polysaccharide/polyol phosphate transport system ATPase subunit